MKYPTTESPQLELKEELVNNNQLIKIVIAFCNTLGGKIVIGVTDDGTIKGISENDAQDALEWLDKMIYESCTPHIIPLINIQRIDHKVLLIIEISSGMNKPYYKTSLGLSEGTFVRLGRSTMKANADMIEELKWQSRGLSYDHLPVYTGNMQDISIDKLKKFINIRRNQKATEITDQLLESYRLMIKEQGRIYPSVCAILCFCENPQKYLSEAYILCTHFAGTQGREVIASRVINGTLLEQFDAAYDFILSQLNKSFTITGAKREEEYEIPLTAIREALMNAILHRNYHIPSPIKIAIYQNRIEFFSPGNFFGPIDINQLESGITYVRNVAIAKILWESKLIEKMGSGFIEIFESYRAKNLLTPEVIEGTNFIKCILPRLPATDTVLNDHNRVLDFIKLNGMAKRSDIIQKLNIPRTTAGRILSHLVLENKIIRIGKGAGTQYKPISATE
ncbi:MAG: hypothetical protein A3J38_06880 [Gammaproteobacteria bacterium RIFCSPHIGHO2_12_FULL_45_9]|nr:MAG: hypothetical protein A3J38_06880 [Gammaproteobacteria bacterium RIFCSPHIGHO2_12_FULL_45_9]